MDASAKFSDPLFRCGMGASWANGNRLMIFPTARNKKPHEDSPSDMAPCSPDLYDVRWHVTFHNPITRKLASESHGIFLSLQKYAADNREEAKASRLVKFSRRYRSILSVCLLNLNKALEEKKYRNDEERFTFESQVDMFYDIDLIWNLCEILFLDVQSPGIMLNQLLDWIRWHFREPDRKVTELVDSEEPEKHDHYWKIIYQYTLQGRLQDARKVLRLHPLSNEEEFEIMDELLRKMPLYAHYSELTLAEFKLRWQHWQDECKRLLSNGDFSSSVNLEVLCRILSADVSVFREIGDCCETWYHHLVSRLLFTDPCVKSHNLQAVAKECVDLYGGLSEQSQVDRILYSALELDLQQVIKNICYFMDNWWFVSHLTDLLYHGGQLDLMQLSHSSQLRESFLLEYAAALMSHDSLWQLGIGYFLNCPFQGRAHVEQYLWCIPLYNERKALKLLNIAETYEMKDLVKMVCKVMSLRSLKNKRLGNALSWAMKSKDATFASYITDKFLRDYNTKGEFSNLDLLENLGLCMLVSDQLTFLGKYCEFHRLYKAEQKKEAGELLIALIESKLAPRYFHETLLLDCLPLLELGIFDRQQTFQLLKSLDELISSDDVQCARLKENENLLRLSLARNLSRVFIENNSRSAMK